MNSNLQEISSYPHSSDHNETNVQPADDNQSAEVAGLGEPHEMLASLIGPAKSSQPNPQTETSEDGADSADTVQSSDANGTVKLKKLKKLQRANDATGVGLVLSKQGRSLPASESQATSESNPVSTKPKSKKLNVPASTNADSASAVSSKPVDAEIDGDANALPTFDMLPLSKPVLQAVKNAGYENPTPIQAEIIPHVLSGRDILAQSQTGTGKTAAFALPILSNLQLDNSKLPKVLVLAPTRELAIQVAKSFETYAENLRGFNVTAIYGGQDYEIQFRQLRRGAHVVVGTPGRVIDHINRGTLDLGSIETLVLDEADEMLNMGFLEDVQFVLERAPEHRQIALFSATLPGPIREIAEEYLNDPVKITIKKKTMTADSIRQRAILVSPREKLDALCRFLEVEDTDGVIVFTKTKDSTIAVAEALNRQGHTAIALNGDMPQKVRERAIDQLKSGHLNVLVATDVAARGLDVRRVSHVFNFDLPHDSESYIHRVGRTGRAGRAGEAIIFLTHSQRGKLRLIERATKQTIEVVDIPTADDINAKRVRQFQEKITEVTSQRDLTLYKELITAYAQESGKPLELIAAALADMAHQGRPFFVKDQPKRQRRERDGYQERDGRNGNSRERRHDQRNNDFGSDGEFGGRRHAKSGGRDFGPPEQGMKRFRVEVGRRDGVRPANLVGAIANEAGIDGQFIGPIKILDSFSTIDLPADLPADLFQTIKNTWVVGKQLRLSSFSTNRSDRPERANYKQGSKPRKSGSKYSNENQTFGDSGQPKSSKSKGFKPKGFGKAEKAGKGKKRKAKNA